MNAKRVKKITILKIFLRILFLLGTLTSCTIDDDFEALENSKTTISTSNSSATGDILDDDVDPTDKD